MKPTHAWHFTPLGRVARWLGSLQLAIPVMMFVTLSLCWGTYLESTQDAKIAKALVYGSYWFLGLMLLVCVSLIFAVVTRFPWKRKHAGFIVVHASLVSLIIGGFWSLYGRVEGHLTLQAGVGAAQIDTDQEQLQLIEHQAGQFNVVASIDAPSRAGRYTIGGIPIEVAEYWDNVREEFDVLNDGPEPYRAVQIQFGPVAESAMWIGDEARGDPPEVMGLRVRVLGAGVAFEPPTTGAAPAPSTTDAPAKTDAPRNYTFALGDAQVQLKAVGEQALPGWTITNIKRFTRAMVAGGGITDDGPSANPALQVTISNGQGSTEQHTAFENFPDMIVSKLVEGTVKSGARLVAPPPSSAAPTVATAAAARPDVDTLVIYGDPKGVRMAFMGKDGTVTKIESDKPLPFDFQAGGRGMRLLSQLDRAHEHSRFVKAPSAEEHRPALVIKYGASTEVVPWKARVPISADGRVVMLQYAPKTYSLPFSIKLDQFRKTDYPGTDMAMAYESDVTYTGGGSDATKATISMNNPLYQAGWKVYQSGFIGDQISVFSVMRDPGLPLTYIASIGLCVGILITFYGRGLSWGHPGIPTPFSTKEATHAPLAAAAHHDLSDSHGRDGAAEPNRLDDRLGLAADPGRRSGDAAGYVRA